MNLYEDDSQREAYEYAHRLHGNLLEDRRHLNQARYELAQRYARAILTISSSAIGFTIALVRFAPSTAGTWVFPVWGLLGLAILCTVLSMRTGEESFDYRIDELEHSQKQKINQVLDEAGIGPHYTDLEDPADGNTLKDKYRQRAQTWTNRLNWTAFGAFFLGLLWFVVASITISPRLMADDNGNGKDGSTNPDYEKMVPPGDRTEEKSATPSDSKPPTPPVPGTSPQDSGGGQGEGGGSDSGDSGSSDGGSEE